MAVRSRISRVRQWINLPPGRLLPAVVAGSTRAPRPPLPVSASAGTRPPRLRCSSFAFPLGVAQLWGQREDAPELKATKRKGTQRVPLRIQKRKLGRLPARVPAHQSNPNHDQARGPRPRLGNAELFGINNLSRDCLKTIGESNNAILPPHRDSF